MAYEGTYRSKGGDVSQIIVISSFCEQGKRNFYF